MKFETSILALAAFTALSSTAFAGPMLYLFDGDNATGYIVNTNTSSYTTFQTFGLAYPVAIVDNTILLHNRDDSASGGAAYDLSGNPTGQTWAGGGAAVSELLDGTSNGINNFAVQCCGGNGNFVWEADLNWQNFTPLFALPVSGFGITYDSASNTLFVVDRSSNLSEYSLAGTLLNSYAVSGGIDAGLSYDPSDGTLWGTINGANTVIQESTAGVVLQTLTVSGLSNGNIWGGEIGGSSVPEPGSILLVGSALIALAARRAKLF